VSLKKTHLLKRNEVRLRLRKIFCCSPKKRGEVLRKLFLYWKSGQGVVEEEKNEREIRD